MLTVKIFSETVVNIQTTKRIHFLPVLVYNWLLYPGVDPNTLYRLSTYCAFCPLWTIKECAFCGQSVRGIIRWGPASESGLPILGRPKLHREGLALCICTFNSERHFTCSNIYCICTYFIALLDFTKKLIPLSDHFPNTPDRLVT